MDYILMIERFVRWSGNDRISKSADLPADFFSRMRMIFSQKKTDLQKDFSPFTGLFFIILYSSDTVSVSLSVSVSGSGLMTSS